VNQEDTNHKHDATKLPAEELRTVESMGLPDIRSTHFYDNKLERWHRDISPHVLGEHVPEEIIIQYDTCRNLYLYAFHVYRFYNVAHHQLYTVLELAIRMLVGEKKLKKYLNKKKKQAKEEGRTVNRGLSICMQYLVEHKLIINEDFPLWQYKSERAQEYAYQEQVYRTMDEQDLKEYQWDETELQKTKFDFNWNFVEVLCHSFPKLRNNYAHGSTTLYSSVLHDFENISIIINKIYERIDLIHKEIQVTKNKEVKC
jgi:hypothetical protein